MTEKVVLIYSGGMDSFTLFRELIAHGHDVACLSFNYGQRHSKELQRAKDVSNRYLQATHEIVDLRQMKHLLKGSSLTSNIDVPEGHYAEENMKATVVPNRNMIMLSIAVGYAISIKATRVYTAVHAGDHDIYPDCREEFIIAMHNLAEIANYQSVSVEAPFIHLTKGGILSSGAQVARLTQNDYLDTWTCYNGRAKACGRCGACVERLEAFHEMGWHDPLEYEDRDFYKETLKIA